MTHNPTLSAFLRLRAFAADDKASPLDRMATGNAAAWLAHAGCYGITADTSLLREIADPKKNPVERATTLARGLVGAMAAAGLPLAAPFQAVDLLYSAGEEDGISSIKFEPANPFGNEMERGPHP